MCEIGAKESIHNTIVFDSKDYSISRRDAWIYGIVVGWDDASLVELQQKHKWTDLDVERLNKLHAEFKALR